MLQSLDLGGTWKARWTDTQRGRSEYANRDQVDPARYINAEVPGEIHLDVMREGWVGDVYRDMNVLNARWVEEQIWSFRREFEVPAEALQQHAWLHFDRLDLTATIVLNGQEIGKHSNTFYPCRLNVTGKLRPGKNVLTVHVESGLYGATDKSTDGYETNLWGKVTKRVWLRKPQCQVSWDWSPRLMNLGITGPVSLEWSPDAIRIDQVVPLVTVDDALSEGTVRARVFIEGLGKEEIAATLSAEIDGSGILASAEIKVQPGLKSYEVTLKVPSPKLWWPTGHGDQPLYTLEIRVDAAGELVGAKTSQIGFRHVRINQDAHPETGRYFMIEINHKPIFVKGGNFVPADMIVARLDRDRYERLIDLALEANFNMLRIWGGGLYESDDFYELCDRKGILVWQEFIFACGKYPVTDQAFHDDVKLEARYNIRRLASHASLVVWCGNNEMEVGAWSWGYDKGIVLPDYSMFHHTLPRLMAEEDPTRFYWPSSPSSPDHREPNDDTVGDQHPWSLGFWDNDFRKYREMVCRFPNEGGSLGPNSLPTMMACLPEGMQHVQSFAWQVHDNSVDSWAEPSPTDQILDFHLGKDIRKMSIEEYAYWGGLVHGEALREYCENFRRRMFSSSCAIFWMYNDTWPCTRSWTIVDYYLRRTPAFHPVRRAMQPVHVVVTCEKGQVTVWGINETREAIVADLRYGVVSLAGDYPMDLPAKVVLPPNTSSRVASFAEDQWKDPKSSLAFASLSRDGQLLARNRLFQPLFREMHWPAAHVAVELKDGQAIFTSRSFAWGVCIDLHGETALADNFFDVYPGVAYSIPWPGSQAPRILAVGNLAVP